MNSNPELPKKSNKKWIILSVIGALLLIAFSFLYNWQRYFAPEDAPQADYGSPAIVIENFDYLESITFKIHEYNEIPKEYRKGIVQTFINNKFYDAEDRSERFHLTNIKDRAPKVFAFGNFTGKSENDQEDLAFLVENEDSSSSILFIISSNGDVLYKKRYDGELPVINSFKKESKIFMDTEQLQPAPEDGLIVQFKYRKSVILYVSKTSNFEEFHQYTKEELDDLKSPRYENEESPSSPDSDSI
ncbi:uncharacterized protein CHSO_0455 [Chryseobacterium sp. StRB126]|uniref:hypothetical protein n=1 Tax=Chryseobacterium sp. StRB126 TaxID=878220 RepID=UPI0004E997B3|nr:hypothetical protein [Chryseobacterium sp. StRB126]BAP29492.1 uncharacterized protein CHSO_0455 [Chryseobacterium sp. StRB126]